MLGNAIFCLHPKLLTLRAQSLSSVSPLNKCDAQSNLRFISLGRVQCSYLNVLKTFSLTSSGFIPILFTFLHLILFSKGRFKRNMMPKKLEKKRQELFTKAKQRHHDRSVLLLRLIRCTFQKPVTRIPSHRGDVVRHRSCEGTLGEAAASLCIQEAAGATSLQPFRTLDSTNVLWVIACYAHQPWAHHCCLQARQKTQDWDFCPRIGTKTRGINVFVDKRLGFMWQD